MGCSAAIVCNKKDNGFANAVIHSHDNSKNYPEYLFSKIFSTVERNTTPEAKRVHVENLLRMVEVCESVSECRRAQVLTYLGEKFSRDLCKRDKRTACDNCLNDHDYKVIGRKVTIYLITVYWAYLNFYELLLL